MKKILALVLALCMVVGLFAGCNNEKPVETKPQETQGSNKPAETKPAETEPAEPIELLWIVRGWEQQEAAYKAIMDKANPIIQEAIGCTLTIKMYDTGSFDEKIKMDMASGGNFDLCFTCDWTNKYADAVANGGLMDITDLINNEVPGLKDQITENYWNAVTIDGRVYCVPNMLGLAKRVSICIRKDLADKYGLDAYNVKTVKELEPFLAAVKAGEPDVIPLRYDSRFLQLWFEAEGIARGFADNYGAYIEAEDANAQVKNIYGSEIYKDYVTTMRDWYDKGYIRADVLSVGDESADMANNRFAVIIDSFTNTEDKEKSMLQNQGMEYYAPLIGISVGNGAQTAMTGISANSKHPVEALKLIELLNNNQELLLLLSKGIKDVNYTETVAEDGSINRAWIPEGGYDPADYAYGGSHSRFADEATKAKMDAADAEAIIPVTVGFSFNPAEYTSVISSMETVVGEYGNGFFYAEDLDAFIAEYAEKMNQAGFAEYTAALQAQVNAFLGK